MIDLSKLNYLDEIRIDEIVKYNDNSFNSSLIKRLFNVHVTGIIYLNELEEYMANLDVTGEMEILDTITLEPRRLHFSFGIDDNIPENCINNKNTLDIHEFLWQNIVLEVPIRYTESDAHDLKGDNWQLLTDNKGGE